MAPKMAMSLVCAYLVGLTAPLSALASDRVAAGKSSFAMRSPMYTDDVDRCSMAGVWSLEQGGFASIEVVGQEFTGDYYVYRYNLSGTPTNEIVTGRMWGSIGENPRELRGKITWTGSLGAARTIYEISSLGNAFSFNAPGYSSVARKVRPGECR